MKAEGVLGTVHKLRRQPEGEGGQQTTNFCLLCLICLPMKGGGGVKNSKNHAYVVYGWSLIPKVLPQDFNHISFMGKV